MGFWKTENGIEISDQYADELEDVIDNAWKKLKKAYPEVTTPQFVETVKFILGRFRGVKDEIKL